MPELNLAPEPSRISASTITIAVVVLAAIAAAAFWFTPHKKANVTVEREQIFAPHTETGALAGSGGMKIVGAASSEDDLYVVADVKIDNNLGLPLDITSFAGTLIPTAGDPVDATIVTTHDIPRLEEIFPKLTPMVKQPLPLDTQLPPKATTSGSILLLFPGMTEADWKAKKSASLTLNLPHQTPLTVALP